MAGSGARAAKELSAADRRSMFGSSTSFQSNLSFHLCGAAADRLCNGSMLCLFCALHLQTYYSGCCVAEVSAALVHRCDGIGNDHATGEQELCWTCLTTEDYESGIFVVRSVKKTVADLGQIRSRSVK